MLSVIFMMDIFFIIICLKQERKIQQTFKEAEAVQLKNVNVNALNPEILQKFLSSGLEEEVDSFVHDYFHAIGRSRWISGVP